MENLELNRVLCGLLAEIAEKEKKKAISLDDYGTAFFAAIFEALFRKAELNIQPLR